jgi:hypothetical protein
MANGKSTILGNSALNVNRGIDMDKQSVMDQIDKDLKGVEGEFISTYYGFMLDEFSPEYQSKIYKLSSIQLRRQLLQERESLMRSLS